MPVFAYKASEASGRVIQGTLEAEAEKQAVAKLQDMGCIPIRVRRAGMAQTQLGRPSLNLPSIFSRVSGKDVMVFTQDLAMLLGAGLPVDRALSILADVSDKDKARDMIQDVLRSVQSGSYLSDALARHPRAFSDFYVSMIRAGEAGGVLEAVLERMGEFLESTQDLIDFIKSAIVYPVFLILVGGVSIIILLVFVMPKFAVIFQDMGQAVPLSTRILLGLGDALRSYWWAMLMGLAGISGAVWYYIQTPGGRITLDRIRIRLPVLGDLTRKIEVARFTRTFGTLIKSGVPILKALTLVENIIGNKVVAQAMGDVQARVKKGDRLSRPLADSGMFPSLAIQMITVGEETGRLEDMLLKVAEGYEKSIRNTIKRLISFLEPALILAMGAVVGFIVISMLMAIFSMNDLPF